MRSRPKWEQGIVVSATDSFFPLALIDTAADLYATHADPFYPPDTAVLPKDFYDWRPLIDVLKIANTIIGGLFISLIGMAYKRDRAKE